LLKPSATTTEQAQLHAIVMDASLSMRYGDRWEHAQEQARKLIDALKPGDRALLVWASGRKIELVAGPMAADDTGALRAALATLKPNFDRLDYGLLMTSSQAWLSANGLPAHIHVITDAQQSASPLRFADLQAPPNAQVHVYDVSGDVSDNGGIIGVDVRGARERTVTVNVRVGAASAKREVVLNMDDREIARKPIAQSVVFAQLQLKSGTHRLHVRLVPNDALPEDDDFYGVIEHTEPSVLLVTHDAQSDEAAYFAAAIESQTLVPLKVVHAAPPSIGNTTLSDYSAVVVADSGLLTAAAAKKISQYVDAGGAAFVTLGPQAARLSNEPITGLRIRKTSADEQRVAQIDDSHPVLRDAAGWRAVRFMRHIVVTPTEHDRNLIMLQDESPLLIEHNAEHVANVQSGGRVLLLAAPLNREWNDLGLHPLFVKFIADAAHYLTGRDSTAMSYTIGAQITTGIVKDTGGQIFSPSGERVLQLSDLAGASHFVPDRQGFYEVRTDNRKRWLAVNVDAREADLAKMNADSIARWQNLTPALAEREKVAAQPTDVPPRSIGWPLLIVTALFLLSELLLANYRLTIRRDGSQSLTKDRDGSQSVTQGRDSSRAGEAVQ
ncbi:MAG TPA: VWA domain-containing protein, partial [Steroidobacteraceae bacterium]|nr:VWA domain-containing protein [Steroidobacteraceae bacterium]